MRLAVALLLLGGTALAKPPPSGTYVLDRPPTILVNQAPWDDIVTDRKGKPLSSWGRWAMLPSPPSKIQVFVRFAANATGTMIVEQHDADDNVVCVVAHEFAGTYSP
jgi:hypothetical protein